jgi:hypothetical protein
MVFLDSGGTNIQAVLGANANEAIKVVYNILQFRHTSDITIDHIQPVLKNGLGESIVTSNMTFSGLSTIPLATAVSSSGIGEVSGSVRLVNPGSTTTFIIDMDQANAGSGRTMAFQLVQFLDASSVATFRASLPGSGVTVVDIPVSTHDPDATWVTCFSDNPASGNDAANLVYSAFMTSAVNVRAFRQGPNAGTADDQSGGFFDGYLVTLDNASIRTGLASIASGFTGGSVSLNTLITRQGASIMPSWQGAFAPMFIPSDVTHTNANGPPPAKVLSGFGSNQTTVELSRISTTPQPNLVEGVMQVIQWNTAGAQFFDTSPWTDELGPDVNQTPQVWDLCEIMSAVTARLGDRWDLPASTVSFWVNQAYQVVANMAHHDGQEVIRWSSMSTGATHFDQRIPLPPDYNEPIVLSTISWDDSRATGFLRKSGTTMTELSNEEFEALDSAATSENPPTHWTQYGRWTEVWPSPSSNYSLQLKYKQYPSDMTDCGIFPFVSPPWRFAIVLKAEHLVAELIGDDQRAAIANNRFVAYTNSLDDDKAKRQKNDSGPARIRLLGWGGPKRI